MEYQEQAGSQSSESRVQCRMEKGPEGMKVKNLDGDSRTTHMSNFGKSLNQIIARNCMVI